LAERRLITQGQRWVAQCAGSAKVTQRANTGKFASGSAGRDGLRQCAYEKRRRPVLAAARFQEKGRHPDETWYRKLRHRDDHWRSGNERLGVASDAFYAFARIEQCDCAGMAGPCAVVMDALTHLRRAGKSERAGAGNSYPGCAATAQKRRPPPVASRAHFGAS